MLREKFIFQAIPIQYDSPLQYMERFSAHHLEHAVTFWQNLVDERRNSGDASAKDIAHHNKSLSILVNLKATIDTRIGEIMINRSRS